MEAVKISPKFQIVIPRRIRESMKLKSGQRVQVFQYNDRIELIPDKKITDMRGFLKGINIDFQREEDRL